MTAPVIEVGADRISEARGQLHTMLVARTELPAERVHRFPQFGGFPTPCVWVGLPTLSPGISGGTNVDFPLVLAADGREEQQVADLDAIAASVWDGAKTVAASGGKASPTSTAVDRLGPDGSTTFALTVIVRVPLAVKTLCPDTAQLDQP